MRILLTGYFTAGFFCLLQCSCPTPAVHPVPDAGTLDAARKDLYELACESLKASGCVEGLYSNCADIMRRAAGAHLVDFHAACVATANNPVAIRACGVEIRCE